MHPHCVDALRKISVENSTLAFKKAMEILRQEKI